MSNLQLAKVLYRNLINPLHIVNADDFTCTNTVSFPEEELNKIKPLVPYAIDPQSRTTIYSAKINIKKSLESAFLYDYLRRNTEIALSAPIDHGNLNQLKDFRIPIFIFSTGRCGSTLLTKIINSHQRITLSEPDFYTQLATLPNEKLSAKDKVFLFNHLTADLVTAYRNANPTENVFIKLRAECNASPMLFIRKKTQKTLFLSRDFSSWTKSILQHFNNPKVTPEVIVNFYIKALNALDFLSQNSDCTHLKYDQLIDTSSDNSLQLLERAISCPINKDQLAEVLSKDSQSRSAVGKDQRKELDQDKYNLCLELFKKNYPTALMDKYQISFE